MTNLNDIELYENMIVNLNLLYKNNKYKEDYSSNSSGTWMHDIDGNEITIPLQDFGVGDNLILEMNFRYELDWDYDYFIIDYVSFR